MKSPLIFDRKVYRHHRGRSSKKTHHADYLIKEAADRLLERIIEDSKIECRSVLEIGSRAGYLEPAIRKHKFVEHYIAGDISYDMLMENSATKLVFDEEFVPFKDAQFDTIISLLNMHWVNDIPGVLVQLHRALKPGGVLICSMLGGSTLRELREAAIEAESTLSNSIYPRISPYTEVKDVGGLLQRTGYALPVTDTDSITVMYKNAFSLMKDLQSMGETNALLERKKQFTSKRTLQAISETYNKRFLNAENEIPATFEIITLTGWKN